MFITVLLFKIISTGMHAIAETEWHHNCVVIATEVLYFDGLVTS